MTPEATPNGEFIVNKTVGHSPADPCLRTGAQFIESLRDDRTVIGDGRQVPDVTREPVLRRGIETLPPLSDAPFPP